MSTLTTIQFYLKQSDLNGFLTTGFDNARNVYFLKTNEAFQLNWFKYLGRQSAMKFWKMQGYSIFAAVHPTIVQPKQSVTRSFAMKSEISTPSPAWNHSFCPPYCRAINCGSWPVGIYYSMKSGVLRHQFTVKSNYFWSRTLLFQVCGSWKGEFTLIDHDGVLVKNEITWTELH